jgi:hypothetical protein
LVADLSGYFPYGLVTATLILAIPGPPYCEIKIEYVPVAGRFTGARL